VNWQLLLFLVLFLNVKLYIKIPAVVFAMVLHRGSPLPKGLLRRKWLAFYLALPLLAAVNLLVSRSFMDPSALLAFALGCTWWILALLAGWHIYLFVQGEDRARLHRTISLFFYLHIAVILASYVYICADAGTLNPYNFRGFHQKYFINAGDFIRGIGLDDPVTTAIISAMGMFYFLYVGKYGASLACMVATLMSGSNFIDIFLVLIFIFLFIFRSDRLQKSMIVVYSLLIVFFASRISPENEGYVKETISHQYFPPDPLIHPTINDRIEDRKVQERRSKLEIYVENNYHRSATDSIQQRYKGWDRSGRWVAWQELWGFLISHPSKAFIGAGMGNFSSRLAYKTAALGIDGSYPQDLRYISPFFRDDYLYIYLYYHIREGGRHSVVNSPDSVYGQLIGEYGLAGLSLFLVLYVASFARGVRRLSYGLPLILLVAAAFFTGYWFERLSIVVVFEFLSWMDRRSADVGPAEGSPGAAADAAGRSSNKSM
jgi:hypothetical protein